VAETSFAGSSSSRFDDGRSGGPWEERVVDEVIRLTEDAPSDVTIVIPAHHSDLGAKLEKASRLMQEHGYRLRQVIADSGITWAASFIRLDDN